MPPSAENSMKLEAAEAKLQDLKANTTILGKEAAAALAAVEAQQQRLTLQRLIAMVLQCALMILRRFNETLDQGNNKQAITSHSSHIYFLL